jgi:hypothetical protein
MRVSPVLDVSLRVGDELALLACRQEGEVGHVRIEDLRPALADGKEAPAMK